MKIELGDKARDTITGLEGTVVARYEFLNGCVQLRLQPAELKDGKPIEGSFFDLQQLELVKKLKTPRRLVAVGGPHDEPAARSIPTR